MKVHSKAKRLHQRRAPLPHRANRPGVLDSDLHLSGKTNPAHQRPPGAGQRKTSRRALKNSIGALMRVRIWNHWALICQKPPGRDWKLDESTSICRRTLLAASTIGRRYAG